MEFSPLVCHMIPNSHVTYQFEVKNGRPGAARDVGVGMGLGRGEQWYSPGASIRVSGLPAMNVVAYD